jgi:thymidylate kinase
MSASVAELVDSIVSARVLVHGSLPPAGRDLDILARPPEMEAVAARLSDEGFVRKGNEFARFEKCTAQLVDAAPSSWWQLPDAETEAVYSDALPIEGYDHLVRPAAHHMLLILTRRLVEGKGYLDEKRRAYVERSLRDDPDAWVGAMARAHVWGASTGLDMLRGMYERNVSLDRSERARAIAERLRSLGGSPSGAHAEAWRTLMKPPERGAIVALSGVDGSGKSTQAEQLAATLTVLGIDAREQWTKLGETPWIWRVARPAKRIMLAVTGGTARSTLPPPSPDRYGPDAGTELRRKSAGLTQAWATLVALSNVMTHWRATQREVLRGRTIVCDRYVLDSVVQLRARYGPDKRFRFQSWLVRILSPRPRRAFLMHVPAETAHERRRDEHELQELAGLVRLYDEERSILNVEQVDGARPIETVCAELATRVWLEL